MKIHSRSETEQVTRSCRIFGIRPSVSRPAYPGGIRCWSNACFARFQANVNWFKVTVRLSLLAFCVLALGCRSDAEYDKVLQWSGSLAADKQDLLVRLAAAESERDTLKRVVYLSESDLVSMRVEIVSQNNPFLHDRLEVTSKLQNAVSLDMFFAELDVMMARVSPAVGIDGERGDAVLAMLLIANVLEFGNPHPRELEPGCISDNLFSVLRPDEGIGFDALRLSSSGCCTDFAILLCRFLEHRGHSCKLALSSGHIVVELPNADGTRDLLDASSALFVRNFGSQEGGKVVIYCFPVTFDSRQWLKQRQYLAAFMFGMEAFRIGDFTSRTIDSHIAEYGVDFCR